MLVTGLWNFILQCESRNGADRQQADRHREGCASRGWHRARGGRQPAEYRFGTVQQGAEAEPQHQIPAGTDTAAHQPPAQKLPKGERFPVCSQKNMPLHSR